MPVSTRVSAVQNNLTLYMVITRLEMSLKKTPNWGGRKAATISSKDQIVNGKSDGRKKKKKKVMHRFFFALPTGSESDAQIWGCGSKFCSLHKLSAI